MIALDKETTNVVNECGSSVLNGRCVNVQEINLGSSGHQDRATPQEVDFQNNNHCPSYQEKIPSVLLHHVPPVDVLVPR